MRVSQNQKFVTISDNRPEMFDRKVNNIISKSQGAEIVFNSTRPLLVHIVYTETPEKGDTGK